MKFPSPWSSPGLYGRCLALAAAGPCSEATLLVLPRELYPVRDVLAPHLQEAFSIARPFVDIETGARFDLGAAVAPRPWLGPLRTKGSGRTV